MRNPELGPRALEISWLNTIVNTHGMICSCEKPWIHLQDILQNQQVRCHLIGDGEDHAFTENTGDADIDHFDQGDLEQLFSEDFTEDSG